MTDFNFITAHVATGGAISSASDVLALVDAGITHVIDCRDDFDDAALLAQHPQIAYLHNGTADDGQPKPVEWFAKSLVFALPALAVTPNLVDPSVGQVSPHPRVYAHCAAGMNRGPSTAFAIMLALDWPADLAEQRIRAQRPQVELRYKDDAIHALTILGY